MILKNRFYINQLVYFSTMHCNVKILCLYEHDSQLYAKVEDDYSVTCDCPECELYESEQEYQMIKNTIKEGDEFYSLSIAIHLPHRTHKFCVIKATCERISDSGDKIYYSDGTIIDRSLCFKTLGLLKKEVIDSIEVYKS